GARLAEQRAGMAAGGYHAALCEGAGISERDLQPGLLGKSGCSAFVEEAGLLGAWGHSRRGAQERWDVPGCGDHVAVTHRTVRGEGRGDRDPQPFLAPLRLTPHA